MVIPFFTSGSPCRRLLQITIGIGVGSVILGLGAGCTRKPQKPPSQSVRVGYLPIYTELPLFVAKDHGFFAKHGVNVELTRFAASPDMGTALSTNNIDAAGSIAYAVALSSESRDPGKLRVVTVDSETRDNYLSSIVVLPTSGIHSLADLRGKKIGSFPGPTAVTFLKLVLEKAGLNPAKDVQITELPAGSHISALQAHTVDALFTYEPIGTQAVQEIGAVKLLPGAVEREIISPWQAGVWVVRNEFQRAHPTETRAFVLALYDAIDFIRSKPDSAKASLSTYTSIKPQVAAATPNIPFAKLGEVDLNALQRQTDILRERGIVSKQIQASNLLAPASWTTTANR